MNQTKGGNGRKIQDTEAEKLVSITDQYAETEKKLNRQIAIEEEELLKGINKINNETYRVILKRKYILGEKLETVADGIGYSYKHTCRLHGYALKEFDKQC